MPEFGLSRANGVDDPARKVTVALRSPGYGRMHRLEWEVPFVDGGAVVEIALYAQQSTTVRK